MTIKPKSDLPPPDNRLAKRFKFTTGDLYANRAGYLSWRQIGWWEMVNQRLLNGMYRLLGREAQTPEFRMGEVKSLCGRARLKHTIVNEAGIRPVFYETFTLQLEGYERLFSLTADQHQTLNENITYRVYYQIAAPNHVLSLERVNTC